MALPSFTFTRNPSIKVPVNINLTGLAPAENTLVLVGRMAASGSSATANVPYQVQNYGDPVAAAAEMVTAFGTGSEIGSMVLAAINAVAGSDSPGSSFPPIVCLPMVSSATTIATTLNANLTLAMPYVASPFPASDATNLGAFNTFLQTISSGDRGAYGQFGSFGFVATLEDLAPAATEGLSLNSQFLLIAWLRDLTSGKANTVAQVAAALAAVCAANGLPYNPLNDVSVGGLVAPSAPADWHTPGDAGTVSLGLGQGLVPLKVTSGGVVRISRTVTTLGASSTTPSTAYCDYQDWAVLYYYRQQCWTTANQPRYRLAKASDQVLLALKSELISLAKDLESLGMLEKVDAFVEQFTVTRSLTNRSAAIYQIPVNVIPGFHNKGIAITGTTEFDSVQITG